MEVKKKIIVYQILCSIFVFGFLVMLYVNRRLWWNITNFEDMNSVVITAYNPVESQCNSKPLIAANGQAICPYTMAISRDLEKKFSLGDTVFVIIPFIIKDRMNTRFNNSADILLFDEKMARAFGKRNAWIAKISKNNGKSKK